MADDSYAELEPLDLRQSLCDRLFGRGVEPEGGRRNHAQVKMLSVPSPKFVDNVSVSEFRTRDIRSS